ncbi:MAG: AAA family ATPase [Nitrospirota bacterium]
MYVREIHINNFRHLKDIHLGPFNQPPEHSDLVVLAGPNAGGKSSVLELLGYALSNSWSLQWSLRRSFPSNSFEVAIAVTPNERRLVHQYLEASKIGYAEEVLKYFEENGTYYRAYNYTEGKYQENAQLYNQIHNLVTSALRNHYSRSLGFFLKSDRYYPPGGFDRHRLFEYQQILNRDYIWNMAFNTSDVQYKDMFEFLVQQRYHYFRRLGAYHHRIKKVSSIVDDPPSDPLKPYDDLLQKLFPGYRFADADEEVPSNLLVQLPSGEMIPFSDLSSGEKEVFFILSFFLRHDVTNAVIVIDEPELHLHPEFARLLIRTMQSIRSGNQIWLATHNTEIIDEAGRDRVIYLARDPQAQKSVITFGTDETEAMRQLKDLFGYSGYIGIAKSIVFLERFDSSSDRKMFSSLFPEYGSKLKFVPCKSSENLNRINAAVLSILV